jgi:hypothetical protein
MSELSPAAQVVLDAAFSVYDEDNLYFVTCEQHARRISAATLRAAADQLKYKLLDVEVVDCSQLRLLADELEAQ